MKDIYQMEVEVGDKILCSGGHYKSLLKRRVIKVTPKTCLVVCESDWNSHTLKELLSLPFYKVEKKVESQVYILGIYDVPTRI